VKRAGHGRRDDADRANGRPGKPGRYRHRWRFARAYAAHQESAAMAKNTTHAR